MKYIKIYYLWREDIAWQLFEVADQEAAASEGMIAPGRKQSEIDFGDDGGAGGDGDGDACGDDDAGGDDDGLMLV